MIGNSIKGTNPARKLKRIYIRKKNFISSSSEGNGYATETYGIIFWKNNRWWLSSLYLKQVDGDEGFRVSLRMKYYEPSAMPECNYEHELFSEDPPNFYDHYIGELSGEERDENYF